MAGTSSKTKPMAARVPVDLADWVEAQGKAGDVIVRALWLLKDGPKQAVADPQTAEALAAMTRDRDQWRDRAKAIVSAGKEPANAASTKTIGHHAAGPVLEPRLNVRGTAKPMFRAGSEAEKRLKA